MLYKLFVTPGSTFDSPHSFLGLSLRTRHVVTGRQVDETLTVLGTVAKRSSAPLRRSFVSRKDDTQRERQQHTPAATTSGTNVPGGKTRRVVRGPKSDWRCLLPNGARRRPRPREGGWGHRMPAGPRKVYPSLVCW